MTTYPPRVLLAELQERTSAAGSRYLTGWLGKARVVGFWGDGEDRDGYPATILKVYVAEPGEHPQGRHGSRPSASASATQEQRRQDRAHRDAMALQARHAELDDPIPC